MKKKLITESNILDLLKTSSNVLRIEKGTILTPAAKDIILHRKIVVEYLENVNLVSEQNKIKNSIVSTSDKLKIAIGSDHTGFNIKNELKDYIKELTKSELIDVGTFSEKSCDYPDFAFEVAKRVSLHQVDFGILFDATGIPSAITANKIPGIRAVTCYNEFSAKSSREHNNANILVVGARTLGIETIKSIIKVWFSSSFLGERHQKRLDKITEIEKKFLFKG